MKTFEPSQVQKVSGSGSIMITDFVILLEKRLSLRAIILIMQKDNRHLDSIFGKPKRLSFCIMSAILSSSVNFKLIKFNRLYTDWCLGIVCILHGSGVITV